MKRALLSFRKVKSAQSQLVQLVLDNSTMVQLLLLSSLLLTSCRIGLGCEDNFQCPSNKQCLDGNCVDEAQYFAVGAVCLIILLLSCCLGCFCCAKLAARTPDARPILVVPSSSVVNLPHPTGPPAYNSMTN